MTATLERAFAVIQPGFEDVLVDELDDLGMDARSVPGGALFDVNRRALHHVHLHARTPTRVWIRLGSFRAVTLDELARGALRLPWDRYVWKRQELDVRVTTRHSRLRFRDRVARKLERAIGDATRRAKMRRGKPLPAARVLARIEDDQVDLSIDASGEALYRRGWRREVAHAPLRENLAAAILRKVGWTPNEALVDPMCGSGTFCIEAATWAQGLPPGGRRPFAFSEWPSADAKRVASPRRTDLGAPVIVGADRSADAVRAAQANARRARVDRALRLEHTAVTRLQPPASSGIVVTNPPWGERIDGAKTSWSALGQALVGAFGGWRVAVLAPRPALVRRLGFPIRPVASFPVGGIRITVYLGTVPGP